MSPSTRGVQGPSSLPSITEFNVGLVTNRNQVASPFLRTVTGQKIVAHDVLSGGLNTEVSPTATIVRRPGYSLFSSTSAEDVWQFKDLLGNITLYEDTGSSLITNSTLVFNYGTGARSPLSAVTRGDFFYLANGVDLKRIQNTAPTVALPWGAPTPSVRLQLGLDSLGYFNAVTGFAPSTDAIAGTLQVTDGEHQRTLTITINPTAIHFNVTYSGNQISQNNSYTTVTAQTQTGTAPNTTTTDVVTVTTGLTSAVTGSGISNGVMNWYPNTGISTLDFDYAYSGTMTISVLSGIISALNAITFTSGTIPFTAYEWLQIFATSSVVSGLWHSPGQSPVATQSGVALNLTVPASLLPTQITVNSGLFDITNPQQSLAASIGVAPRNYQFVSPAANVTDTFTGTFQMYSTLHGFATLFTFTDATLFEIFNSVTGIVVSGSYESTYVQTGKTCYATISSIATAPTGSTPGTADNVIAMSVNTMVNNNDTNENFQSWTFLESNDYPQLPQQGVNISYAARDIVSGGLSNLSEPLEVGPQLYPSRYKLTLNLPYGIYDHNVTNLEVYRTVDGGSSYLFEQVMQYQNSILYTTTFNITDAGLNDQLIGPIDEEADPPPPGLRQIAEHTGRLWGVVDNRVYFSGGPDTTNGNGDESWPPGNNFQFPGNVTDIKSTDSGLIVALTDDLHVITGVDSSSYYAKPWIAGFGISSPTAWDFDKQTLYLYTTTRQLQSLNNGELREIGFNIGDQLASLFPPTTTSVTFHRSTSLDTALYISNGTDVIFRYDTKKAAWSPMQQPQIVGAGRVRSLETSTAVQTLLNCTENGVFARNLTVFTDNGVAYPANVTVGVMSLAPLGQVVSISNIAAYLTTAGALPQMWLLFNEIAPSTAAPFLQLFNPQNDPPDAPASVSIAAKRWYVESTITPFRTGTRLVNLASIQLVFSPTGTTKDELLTLQLRDAI